MKNEYDNLTVDDMKYIDSKILNLNIKLQNYFNNYNPYTSISNEYKRYDFLWLEDVQYIEDAIDYIASFLYKTAGYIDKKIWLNNYEIVDRTFDYSDYNRWNINLNLLESIDITKEQWLWNLKEYNAQWGKEIDLEWSELDG